MKKYSLFTCLFSGLVFCLFSFILLFVYIYLDFKLATVDYLSKQCATTTCSPQIIEALANKNFLDIVYYDVMFRMLPWAILFFTIFAMSAYLLFKNISYSLQEMHHRALRFSLGSFDAGISDYRIKEINKFALTMNNLGAKLQGLELLRKDFVANVSHELKTPITSIKGYIETLLDGEVNDPEEVKQFLSVVKVQADRMNSVIEDLILISKLENENTAINLVKDERFLGEMLTALKNKYRLIAKEKKIKLEIDCPMELSLSCNAVLLEQALSNVIDNSIKYCKEGSRVELVATSGAEIVEVVVKDNGPGISANHLPRIFERFYRVDRARSRMTGGSGLGLSITKHIVSAHGGRIFVKSERGMGTEFIIELPKAA